MKKLIIVESPTKAKTITRFLGDEYDIKYSMGHIIDLPKSKVGIDIEHDFAPQYELMENKLEIVKGLEKAAKTTEMIILATDPDREGEAIAANIKELLGKNTTKPFQRIVFHEITKEAIQEAIKNPRSIDANLVNAQIARRVLDRLVGYKLSPLLWSKVRRGLSAGRVQSIALRLIVEREKEIMAFDKEAYWTISALMSKTNSPDKLRFELVQINGEKIEKQVKFSFYDGEYKVSKTVLDTQVKAEEILADIKTKRFSVSDTQIKESRRSPLPPYTTSTLQQDASRRLGLAGKRTMSLAQKLYEEGFITYHRTDSVTLSESAITQMRSFVKKNYGEKYLPEKPRLYTAKQKLAQEAHEGIRPTNVSVLDSHIQQELGRDYSRLYELIWRRSVASQMADAILEATTVLTTSADSNKMYQLKANGSVLLFDGFLKINPLALQDTRLPKFTSGEDLKTHEVILESHETPPPPRFNDASLIQTLEEKGIGRPSTYASIISTLVDRTYIERVEKRFEPTSVGIAVNDFLVKNFSDIDDIPFTAHMEDSLDEIANGDLDWVTMMREFYDPFAKKLDLVKGAARVKIAVEQTNEECDLCGAPLIIRQGKFGKFLACSTFPECKFTKPLVLTTDLLCPKDNGKVIIKKTRKGRKFFGCSNYPQCDFAAWKIEDIKGYVKPSTEATLPAEQAVVKMDY